MEARILPAEERLDMLFLQNLVSFFRHSHPSHAAVAAPDKPRRMKQTLQSKHAVSVLRLLSNGVTTLHTRF